MQLYVDDIIFSAINKSPCKEFVELMLGEFEMSIMEKLTYFLSLQIKQLKEGIFICQLKYVKEYYSKVLIWKKLRPLEP